jgi:exosortase/archaeosortase family protein
MGLLIHIRNINIHRAGRSLSRPGFLWKAAACLQALLSIWLVQATQHTPSFTLLAMVVWGGAVICMEDQLDALTVQPSRASLNAGLLLLAYATWKSCTILDKDTSIFILPFIQGLGLIMLAKPIRKLFSLRQPLFVLSLFPLQALLTRLLPEQLLASLTGRISQILLLLFGENAAASGQMVAVGGEVVFITGSCNSIDLIAQLMAIAIVFVLAFPIQSVAAKASYVAIAPMIAVLFNAVRIAILAAVNGSTLANREQVFEFLHDEWGALVFAGLAMMAMGQIYLSMIDHHLSQRHG